MKLTTEQMELLKKVYINIDKTKPYYNRINSGDTVCTITGNKGSSPLNRMYAHYPLGIKNINYLDKVKDKETHYTMQVILHYQDKENNKETTIVKYIRTENLKDNSEVNITIDKINIPNNKEIYDERWI